MTGLIESPFFPGPVIPPSFYAVNRDVYSYEINSTVAQEYVVVEFPDWNLDPSSTFSVRFQYSLKNKYYVLHVHVLVKHFA